MTFAVSLPSSFLFLCSHTFNTLLTKCETGDKEAFVKVIKSIYSEVVAAEPALTHYDTVLGDGDCGTTLLAGAQAMLQGAETGDRKSVV